VRLAAGFAMADKVVAESRARAALNQEVRWMRSALEASDLNERIFRAYLILLSSWSDAQILALAEALFPAKRFVRRSEALTALEGLHRRRIRLLLELQGTFAVSSPGSSPQ
jgi:hypothetical protein